MTTNLSIITIVAAEIAYDQFFDVGPAQYVCTRGHTHAEDVKYCKECGSKYISKVQALSAKEAFQKHAKAIFDKTPEALIVSIQEKESVIGSKRRDVGFFVRDDKLYLGSLVLNATNDISDETYKGPPIRSIMAAEQRVMTVAETLGTKVEPNLYTFVNVF